MHMCSICLAWPLFPIVPVYARLPTMGAELRTLVELKKIAELLQGHYKECARILTDIRFGEVPEGPKAAGASRLNIEELHQYNA